MTRSLLLSIAAAVLIALPATAQTACNLGMTANCSSGTCTATTVNNGSNTCSGKFFIGIELFGQNSGAGSVGALQNSLGLSTLCFSSDSFPGVALPPLSVCIGNASLAPGASFTMSAPVNPGTGGSLSNAAAFTFVTDPQSGTELANVYVFNNGGPTASCTPLASVPSAAQSGVTYTVSWLPVTQPGATYIVEESTSPDFSAITASQTTSSLSATFTHSAGTNTTYYYRVHAVTCSGAPGPNSPTVSIVVQAIPTVTARQGDVTTPVGSTTPVSMRVFIPGPASKGKQAQDVGFTASTDKPYLTVSPSSGTIGPSGTTVTVTADPSNLPPGANTGTLTVTANGSTLASKSVSVSLVTPVMPAGKGLPPPNALIIPAVAHAQGAFGPFQSDVRLTNASTAATSYQVTYTPTRTDATQNSKTTQISVDPGKTIALNDILRDFFGVGATDDPSDKGQGTLEIRPLNSASSLNYASSRLFTFDLNGNTYGQFVAAIPFSQFATKASIAPIPGGPPAPTGTPTISLQQISCCTGAFRTNLGLVEGSGAQASGNIKLYDDGGTLLKTVSYTLLPGEHRQDRMDAWGLPEISDGRIEVTVESPAGAVTAYASVLDNTTQDPLEVTPVQVSSVRATRYIQPGVASVNPTAPNNFHSDVRVYNGGSATATVTPTLYSFVGNPPKTLSPFTIAPGEVKTFNDVVATMFNSSNDGGSIVFTTSGNSSLVTTGRTYTIDPSQHNGTFGQFIPGVTSTQGVGAGEKPLQILQLEESTNFRTNVGMVEVTGNTPTVTQCGGPLPSPVTACVHVTAFVPDSKVAASTDIPLAPNQFVQSNRILASMYPGQNIYNARISVEVTAGSGRVAAYGSVIDNKSLDPTYVPAQSAQ